MVQWKHRSQRFILYWSIIQIQLYQREWGNTTPSLPPLCSWHRLHPFTNSWLFFWMNMYMQHASLRRTGPVVWTQTKRQQDFQRLLSCKLHFPDPSEFLRQEEWAVINFISAEIKSSNCDNTRYHWFVFWQLPTITIHWFMIIINHHPSIHTFSSESLGYWHRSQQVTCHVGKTQPGQISHTHTGHSGEYFIFDRRNLHVETREYRKRKKYSHEAQGEHANTEKP